MFAKLFLSFVFVLHVKAFQNKYCQLTCDYVVKTFPHTVCEREDQECGPGPLCGPDFKIVELNNADRQYILDIHNFLRNKVAMGNEKNGSQPSAANMNILKYNKELEYISQCWANTCNGKPLLHDSCRRTFEFEHVGQNLGFINSSLPKIEIVKSIKELTLLWYNEVAIFQKDWVNDTQDRGPSVKVGHYTQMLWADATDIGCAATYYSTNSTNDKKWYHIVYVCNYGPGGNYIGAPVYKIGKPCSECPNGLKQNDRYNGLCGESKKVEESIKEYDKSIFKTWYKIKNSNLF